MAKSKSKTPAKSSPSPKNDPANAAAADDETNYTMADVSKRLGDATEAEVRLDIEALSDAQLIAKGREIATSRLVKELSRNYGIYAAWLPRATEGQLDQLGFIGLDWLRLAAWAGRQAEIKHEALQRGAHGSAADKLLRKTTADTLSAQAKTTRDWLYNAVSHLSGGLASWKTKIDTAYAASVTSAPVADSILAMADVADSMLADTSPGMVARRKRSRLTGAKIKECRDLAKKMIQAAKAAEAVMKAPAVTQSDVDLWDGVAVTFFEQFVDMAEDAHTADPSIPRPSILGLRSWFRRLSRKKLADDGGSEGDGGAAGSDEPAGEGGDG